MISPEFKAAISERNLLLTRIMLKDSFVVDPTLVQFNEMLNYAKNNLADLFVPFDGGILEEEEEKWNDEIMNEELVQLINNFSETRIFHLKRVVPKVLELEAKKITNESIVKKSQNFSSKEFTRHIGNNSSVNKNQFQTPKSRETIMKDLYNEAKKIQIIINNCQSRKSFSMPDIDNIALIAEQILKFYKFLNK